MTAREMIFCRSAEVGGPGRFRGSPPLTVIDAPGMDHDDGCTCGTQAIGHFNDSPGVVGKPPRPHLEIGILVLDQKRGFIARCLANRLDELRMVRKQRPGIGNRGQLVLIDAWGRLPRPGSGDRKAKEQSARNDTPTCFHRLHTRSLVG